MKTVTMFLCFYVWAQLLPCFAAAQTPIQKEVEKATLQISLDFSNTGEAALKVKKVNRTSYEPEEIARLLSHWFSKALYLLPSPMPRMFLLNEAEQSLFQLKPRDNVLRKAQIDDVVKLVDNLGKERVDSSINLYLRELPNDMRGLVSYLSRDVTEQQTAFSWAIILQYATQNYSAKDIAFTYNIMAETIKAYSGGADPDAVENTVIIPNDSFFRIKAGFFDKFRKKPAMSIGDAATILSGSILESAVMNADAVRKFCKEENHQELNIDAWKLWEIIFEFQFLFLHITDRLSFDILDQDKRSIFMDTLLEITVDSTIESAFKSLDLNGKNKLKSSMINDYNTSQVEYEKHKKMFPKKNESPKDTVFWEFRKKLAERVGHPMNISYIMLGTELAAASLKGLDINNILQSMH